jgi:2-polyprenyl-6-hydroxyphenyl methylase/3-demethylubiquinone-9 3-methyltransferase
VHSDHRHEIASGERFEFGRNWRRFLASVNEGRIEAAERALTEKLGDVRGMSFLDIGCGSGMSSLAAHRLGALVSSFDYDPECVACTLELQRRFGAAWPTREGSALDSDFLRRLGAFDIVYSWGVLQHTGAMWNALENMVPLVKPGGSLFIAIYNDQGPMSKVWRFVKRLYNRYRVLRPVIVSLSFVYLRGPAIVRDTFAKGSPFAVFRRTTRGMSSWHDLIDWVGGYPFEVAKPEDIFRFYRDRGFTLIELTTCGGKLGCNEYVFRRSLNAARPPTGTKAGAPERQC